MSRSPPPAGKGPAPAGPAFYRIVCPCGTKLRIRGARPGGVCRCPRCNQQHTIAAMPAALLGGQPSAGGIAGVNVGTCSACYAPIGPGEERHTCPACGLVFHADCWQENLGCSRYGCSQVNALRRGPDLAIPVPAAEAAQDPRTTDSVCRYALPYPLAALYRLARGNHEASARFGFALRLAEGIFRFLALVNLADAAAAGATDRQMHDWLQTLERPGMGKLLGLLRSTTGHLAAGPGPFLAELPAVLGEEWEAAAAGVIEIRNRWTHEEVQVTNAEARPLLEELAPLLRTVLLGAQFLARYQLGTAQGLRAAGGGRFTWFWYASRGTEETCEPVGLKGGAAVSDNLLMLLHPGRDEALYLAPFFYWGLTRGDRAAHVAWLHALERRDGGEQVGRYRHPVLRQDVVCGLPDPADPEGPGVAVKDYVRRRAEWPGRAALGLLPESVAVLRGPTLPATFQERYRLIGKLGEGGMGTVFEVEDTALRRRCALKVLHSDFVRSPHAVHRFLREGKVLAQVKHPNVVEVFDVGLSPEQAPYLVMDLADGEDLEQRLARAGPLPAADAVRLLSAVLEALDAVHKAGVVHRDVKPSNLILCGSAVQLVDFGIAAAADGTRLTQTTDRMGTLHYMAPEQWEGQFSPRSDVYACGRVLFALLAGRPPRQPGEKLRDAAPAVPRALDEVYETATAADPTARYSSALAMAAALQTALERYEAEPEPKQSEPTHALPESPRQSPTANPSVAATTDADRSLGHDSQDSMTLSGDRPTLTRQVLPGADALRALWLWFAICCGVGSLVWASVILFALVAVFSGSTSTTTDQGALVGMGLLEMIGAALYLANTALLMILLYRCWALLEDAPGTVSPGLAVGLLFVPFFNLYWVFVACYGLARVMNRQLRRCQIWKPQVPEALGLAVCIVWCASIVAGVLTVASSAFFLLALVLCLANSVLWILFAYSLAQAATAVAAPRNDSVAQLAGPSFAVTPTAGRSFWYNSLVYMTLFGLGGGLLAWPPGEGVQWLTRTTLDSAKARSLERLKTRARELDDAVARGSLTQTNGQAQFDASVAQEKESMDRLSYVLLIAFIVVCGAAIASCIAVAEPVIERNWPMAIFQGSLGLVVGTFGGAVVGLFIDAFYHALGGGQEGGTSLAVQILARAIGWAVLGMFLCASAGLGLRSFKKCLCGVAGGLVGGLIGGCLFDPIGLLAHSDVMSRFVVIVTIGGLSGLATALIENAAKTSWVRMAHGPIPGKQFILYRNPTYVGSSPQCEIYLFKYPAVAPRHAALYVVPGGFELEDLQSGMPTYVNGRPVRRQRLRNDDQVQVGSTVFLFQERRRQP